MPIAMPVDLPLGGLLIDLVSAAVAVLAGLSGLFGGTAHYLAVFAGGTQRRIEVRTGTGFFIGMAFGMFLLVSDSFV